MPDDQKQLMSDGRIPYRYSLGKLYRELLAMIQKEGSRTLQFRVNASSGLEWRWSDDTEWTGIFDLSKLPTLGAAGSQGVQGERGERGERGEQGSVGPMGPRGDKGDQGNPGPLGPAGPPGPDGAPGGQGISGSPGLPGERGPIGPVGPQGQIGLQGLTGERGLTGQAGPTGSAGAKGDQGLQGQAGAKGDTGPAGAAGAQPEIITGTVVTAGTKVAVKFAKTYASAPVVLPSITWLGQQMIIGSASEITTTGCNVTVMQSRGTLLLTTGPFESAAAGVAFRMLVLGT